MSRAVMRDEWQALVGEVRISFDDAGAFRLLGVGLEQIYAGLSRLEASTRSSMYNMQRALPFDPNADAFDLLAESRARGVDCRVIVSPYAVKTNALLSSIEPDALVGPVAGQMLLVDQNRVVMAGPATASGFQTAWLSSADEVVARAVRLWDYTLAESVPVAQLDPREPLTERQVAVARLVALGEGTRPISRKLVISERTVEREIEAIMAHLGADSRSRAVAIMLGHATSHVFRGVRLPGED